MTEPRELALWHGRLARARTGRELLDLLLSPADAKQRVRALPAPDLYHYITRIGLADSAELLALASPEQIRTFIDFDAWSGDELSLERLDPWLDALMRAGPEVLCRSILALDDELINWLVRRSVRVIVVDDPNTFEPPEGEYVLTPDGRLCVVFPEPGPRDLPVKLFLDWLMRVDPAFCYNLLVFSAAALDSVLQENAWRWRSGRMADLGYVDPYEALVVYTPPRPDQVRAARAALPGDVPTATHWLVPVVAPADRLAAALDHLSPEGRRLFQEGLAYLVNMALAADRVEMWDEEGQRPVLERVRAGILLGLEALAGPDGSPERDAAVLAETSLVFIFRTGYGAVLEAVAPLRRAVARGRLAGPGGPVDAVDLPRLRPWAEALSARHPHLPDGRPPASAVDLDAMRREAERLADLAERAGDERPRDVGLGAWLFTGLTRALLGLEGFGPLPADRLEPAHAALFAGGALRPEAREAARDLWRRWGGESTASLDALLEEAEEQMAGIAPDTALDPRFLPLWLVGPPSADGGESA